MATDTRSWIQTNLNTTTIIGKAAETVSIPAFEHKSDMKAQLKKILKSWSNLIFPFSASHWHCLASKEWNKIPRTPTDVGSPPVGWTPEPKITYRNICYSYIRPTYQRILSFEWWFSTWRPTGLAPLLHRKNSSPPYWAGAHARYVERTWKPIDTFTGGCTVGEIK